ncbi:MAG: hypothetical protein ACR2NZ_21810 [Rubripirellula sp.]
MSRKEPLTCPGDRVPIRCVDEVQENMRQTPRSRASGSDWRFRVVIGMFITLCMIAAGDIVAHGQTPGVGASDITNSNVADSGLIATPGATAPGTTTPGSAATPGVSRSTSEGFDPGFCIVQPEEPASVEIHADYEGRRFYFCCEVCRRDFLSDPSRFDSLVSEEGVDAFQYNDQPDAYADTFWGRVGRLTLSVQAVGSWFERVFHLEDPRSLTLASLFLISLGGIGYRWWSGRRAGLTRSPTLVVAGMILLAFVPCFYADALRHDLKRTSDELGETIEKASRFERQYRDLSDEDQIHYATFLNFGDPPIPRPNPLDPALQRTYFRGNDERSDLMSYGGNYRTVTFDLWIEDGDGQRLAVGSQLVDESGAPIEWFLKVRFERASQTASGYFTDQYMQRMYVTMESGHYLGRDEPVSDRVPWDMVEHEQVWVARYPLPSGVFERTESTLPGEIARERKIDSDRPRDLSGVVYLCEDRYDHNRMLGGRFHYAVAYDIRSSENVVSEESDLWMEATYRGRNFADLQISNEEWLSEAPIPEK